MRDSDTLKTLQIVGVWRLHQDDAYADHEQYPDADDHGDERNFIHRQCPFLGEEWKTSARAACFSV